MISSEHISHEDFSIEMLNPVKLEPLVDPLSIDENSDPSQRDGEKNNVGLDSDREKSATRRIFLR